MTLNKVITKSNWSLGELSSIWLLGVQVAVEGEGWMFLAIDNYQWLWHLLNVRVATAKSLFKLCIIMKRFWRLVIRVISYGSSQVLVFWGDTCLTGAIDVLQGAVVQKYSFGWFSLLFLRVSNHQLVGKMKLLHLNSNFGLTLLAWVFLAPLWTTRPRYC